MNNYHIAEKLIGTLEEEFEGHTIYIEKNFDHYRGGYEWSASKDNEVLDSGLAFSIESAASEAKNSITELNKQ